MANVIDELNREQLRTDVPQFGPGDTVRVGAVELEWQPEPWA